MVFFDRVNVSIESSNIWARFLSLAIMLYVEHIGYIQYVEYVELKIYVVIEKNNNFGFYKRDILHMTKSRKSKNTSRGGLGTFFSNLFGGAKNAAAYRSSSRKSKNSKASRENALRAGGKPYAEFVRGNYGVARDIVAKTGKTGRALSQATFRTLGKMWHAEKSGKVGVSVKASRAYNRNLVGDTYNKARNTGIRAGKAGTNLFRTATKASRKYSSKKKSGRSNNPFIVFSQQNYQLAKESVLESGKTGAEVPRDTARLLGVWYRDKKHKSHKKTAESYHRKSHSAHCKASRRYGSKKGSKKGAVVCICGLIKAKKNDSSLKNSTKNSAKFSNSYKSSRSWTKKVGPLNKGTLTDFGYHAKIKSTEERRAKLKQSVAKYGWVPVMRKLTLVANFNARTHPSRSKVFRSDARWVSRTYKTK
jgi:hypothetical protein